MAKKVIGYIDLFWTCPNCGSENLGSHAFCTSCGSSQPKSVQFHQSDKQQLLTDPEKIKRAKAGVDIHCGFCGTRNPATATVCSQCGADLKAGTRRYAGTVVGAFSQGAVQPIKCPNCGTMNAGSRLKCGNCGAPLPHGTSAKAEPAATAALPMNRTLLFIGGGILLLLCAAFYFLFIRTQTITGVVTGVHWTQSVIIEGYGPVEQQAWRDQIPSGASQFSCSEKVRSSQDQPPAAGRYDEVCGTPYTRDLGNGQAEVVQDCEYQVYDDYCSYVIDAWSPVATVQASGADLNAIWPSPALGSNQRLGEKSADYVCTFDAEGKTYSYHTSSLADYQRCVIGSTWSLKVNGAGAVVDISPSR